MHVPTHDLQLVHIKQTKFHQGGMQACYVYMHYLNPHLKTFQEFIPQTPSLECCYPVDFNNPHLRPALAYIHHQLILS